MSLQLQQQSPQPWHFCGEQKPPNRPLTSAQTPYGVGEAVILVGVVLAGVLVDDTQVLIPVRPVHLVHSAREKTGRDARGRGGGSEGPKIR